MVWGLGVYGLWGCRIHIGFQAHLCRDEGLSAQASSDLGFRGDFLSPGFYHIWEESGIGDWLSLSVKGFKLNPLRPRD